MPTRSVRPPRRAGSHATSARVCDLEQSVSWAPETRGDLGGYRIVRELGRGGMGSVYEAEHLRLGRKAALKVLDPQLASDESFRERFIQESRLIAAIEHPNIIQIYDAAEADGVLYIAMRYVDGYDLQALIDRDGPLQPERALTILEQAAAALDAAHARDLVHRDVKPANILIDEPTGRVFVADFGIAKHAGTRGATKAGLFIGTVDYAPPEQIEGRPTSRAADVYSLGCVLYDALTGRRPFEKDSDVAIIYAHLLEPPPKISERQPHLAPALDEVVAKALAKDAGERFSSCGELVAAARAALGYGLATPTAARPVPTAAVAAAPVREPLASNLPMPATPLVGREREVATITELLAGDDIRLLTITGPGGAGKTRLAIEAGGALETAFADGVFFVALAAIGDAGLVPAALAEVLGVREEALLDTHAEGDGAGDPTAALIRRLQQRLSDARLLLILDNFEHVLPSASLIAELLSSAPRLKVLVTSQAALRLQREHEFPAPPLALPPRGVTDIATLSENPTIALFLQRARAVRPDFELTEQNAPAIVELCIRLDGLPLAIELAAARVKTLSPEAMLARLENRFDLLTGGARDLPSRHQTLRGTIDWSYDLLVVPEQALFARLAVFEGGCTLDAAESVCGKDPASVIEGIESLIDKSLVRQEEDVAGDVRFEMLQTIQEYARYRLIERGEVDDMRRRHAEYFLAIAEGAEPELLGVGQADWVRRLEDDAANLRAALSWSVDGDLEVGLRIAGALTRFWSVRGQMSEGRRWLDQALAQPVPAAEAVRAKALFAAGYSALGQGDYDDAFRRFTESLELYRSIPDSRGTAMCLAQHGWLLTARGELDRAKAVSSESLGLARELDDRRTASLALSNLAEVAARDGDYDGAKELFEEALRLRRELGDRRNIANALFNLGRTELIRHNDDRAAPLLEEGLELASGVSDTWGMSLALSSLGRIALRSGDEARAAAMLGEALGWCRERGDKAAAAECLTGLAAVAASRGDASRAARLSGAATALREEMGVPASPVERSIDEEHLVPVRDALGADVFASEYTVGAALDFEQAVRYALEPRVEAQP